VGKVELKIRALEYYEGMFRISKALPTGDSQLQAAVGKDFNFKKAPFGLLPRVRATPHAQLSSRHNLR
jgi:hypothetical protein